MSEGHGRGRGSAASPFSSIPDAIAAIARGEIVVVVDDPLRENEGDFVMAAERVTPDAVNFMVTHGRGLVCMPMTAERADQLRLRPMAPPGQPTGGTAFTVPIDLRDPPSTGISAYDRAACIRRAAAPDARPEEFHTPGHVFPLRAQQGGVLTRPGHTEAAVDLARLAGLEPAGAICEILNEDGTMARLADLVDVARTHGLHLIRIADLIAYRLRTEALTRRVAEARMPTAEGSFRAIGYESDVDGRHHVALLYGRPEGHSGALVRVHVECLAGDVFRGVRCECGDRLREAMRAVVAHGEGVIVYLRRQEAHMLHLVHGQEAAEPADFAAAGQILLDLGISRLRLLGDGEEAARLTGCGLEIVERIPLRPALDNVLPLAPHGETDHDLLGFERFEIMT